jgi:predicted transcriptional regulator
MSDDITSLALSHRVVLLGVTHLSLNDETPAHAGQVIRTATDHAEAFEDHAVGKLTEAEVSRALGRLEDEGHVAIAEAGQTSPVGKGRPKYDLTADAETVLETLADDDQVGGLVERVAE